MEVELSNICETQPQLIDVHQLAKILHVSAHTVRGLRCRNPSALPRAVKIGGSVRWRLADVEAFLDDHIEVTDVHETES